VGPWPLALLATPLTVWEKLQTHMKNCPSGAHLARCSDEALKSANGQDQNCISQRSDIRQAMKFHESYTASLV